MTRRIESHLAGALGKAALRIGEVVVRRSEVGFVILHAADAGDSDNPIDITTPGLQSYSDPVEARRIALFDAAGRYRPLKSAPTLIHGWILRLPRVEEVREALEGFYPGAVGNWVTWLAGNPRPTALRDTLNRQTGMYRVTAHATDEQADATVQSFCHPGCLKRILWGRATDEPIPGLPPVKLPPCRSQAGGEIPLLCYEACSLLVAELREVVKSRDSR